MKRLKKQKGTLNVNEKEIGKQILEEQVNEGKNLHSKYIIKQKNSQTESVT